MKSRINAALERLAKQLLIESESMVLIGRQMILPAALRHQNEMALTVHNTVNAGVDCEDQRQALQQFVELVYRFTASLSALAEADDYESEDPYELALYLKQAIVPMMNSVRQLADTLEIQVANDLWPLPSYRDLLFVK